MLSEPWRIELFGGLRAWQKEHQITRFRTVKSGLLMAYLACHPSQAHTREALVELFWPGDDLEAGRNQLRVALSALRHQLEPPGVSAGEVLIADRFTLRLNGAAFLTDVAEFDAAVKAAGHTPEESAQVAALVAAIDLYRGPFLQGYEADWIGAEREWRTEAYLNALRRLVRLLAQARDFDSALDYARRIVRSDPLREEAHFDLMRLYVAVGQPSAALSQYHEMETTFLAELQTRPGAQVRHLAEQLRQKLGHDVARHAASPAEQAPSPPPISPAPLSQPPLEKAARTHNLPVLFSRFFGRERELTDLLALLHPQEADPTAPRLVTLTGPGGNGKTRLSIEAGHRMQGRFPGGIWFVALGDLSDPRQIGGALADALPLARNPRQDEMQQALELLAVSPALLLFDNFEHLVEGGKEIVAFLLQEVPSLTLLVTSRRSLGVEGEQEFPVLPLPPPEAAQSPERLAQVASVQLFVNRAQRARSDFQITARNAEAITEVCRRLEGIPLALELAAARARVLTPAQMRDRLAQNFDLLVNQHAGKDTRHRSLRATIEWSFRLLSPSLRRLFARLSVFQGGWDLSAAETVCAFPDLLDSLEQLRNDSLIVTEETEDGIRFRMLETLREYAAEQLHAEEAADLCAHHAAYFLALAEQAEAAMRGPEAREWLDRLDREKENLRLALAWSLRHAEEMNLKFVGALWLFWQIRGYVQEGRQHLARSLAAVDTLRGTLIHARALNTAGTLAAAQGDYAASQPFHEEALTIRRSLGHRDGVIVSLSNLAILAQDQGDPVRAKALYEESLALSREAGDSYRIAAALNNLGSLSSRIGIYADARVYLTEALAIREALGSPIVIATTLTNLGGVAYFLEDFAAARAYHERSLVIRRELGDQTTIASSLGNLAEVLIALGQEAEAHALLAESVPLWLAQAHRVGLAFALHGFGRLALVAGNMARAAQCWGASEGLHHGAAYSPIEQAQWENGRATLRAALGADAFEAAWQRGKALSLQEAAALALEGSSALRISCI